MAERQPRQPRQPKPGSRARDDAQAAYSRGREKSAAAGLQKAKKLEGRVDALKELAAKQRSKTRKGKASG